MSNRTAYIVSTILILFTIVAGLIHYSALPAQMASHWNLQGQVNGTMSRSAVLVVMPIVSVVLLILFALIPRIDPLRNNIAAFRREYNAFVVAIIAMLSVVQLAVIAVNLGAPVDIKLVTLFCVGVLMFFIEMILPKTKRNFFIGIRTPWTLSSDVVWDKTHKLGGLLIKILGVVYIVLAFVPGPYNVWLIIVPLGIVLVWTVVYSYIVYSKLEKGGV